MAVLRLALAALMVLLLVPGCTAPVAQRDLVRALAEMGCGGAPAVEFQRLGSRVVLSVSVQECVIAHPRGTAELAGRAEAARAMGNAVWSTSTYRFDSVVATVYRTAEDPDRTRPQPVELGRAELAALFGPRDPAFDSSRWFDDGGRAAWKYLPLIAAVGGVLLFTGMVGAIRAGQVLPILFIRR